MAFGRKRKGQEPDEKGPGKRRGPFGKRGRDREGPAAPPKEVRIYEPTPGKKVTVLVVGVLAILLIVSALLYFMIIPRTSLDIQTVYHERLGGGSTGGGININIVFTNDGTRKITGLDYTLTVINQSDVQVLRVSENVGLLETRELKEAKNQFIGNHLETYYITLSVTFSVEGKSYSKDFSYRTEEDSMNMDFRDAIKG